MTGRFYLDLFHCALSSHAYLSVAGTGRLRSRSCSNLASSGWFHCFVCCVKALVSIPRPASPLGTGPNSYMVRQLLHEAGVKVLLPELVGDIGVAIQLVEANGSMTSIVTTGVESEPSREALDALEIHER